VRIAVADRHEDTIERIPPPEPTRPRPGGRTRLTGVAALGVLVAVTAGGALAGALDAGLLLGAVLATLLVRRTTAWVIIPLPPLVFVAVATVTRFMAARQPTRVVLTALGTTMAKAFPVLLAATLLTVLLAAARNLVNRRPRKHI
jgi:hypothetical protein